MIHFSFSTVYMAILASNAMLVVLTIYFHKKELMVNAGYRLLSFVAYFTILRLLIPLEFPFTINLYMLHGLSYVVSRIRRPFYRLWGFDVSIWSIVAGIWIIGFVVCSLIYFISELNFRRNVRDNGKDVTVDFPYLDIIEQICLEKGKKNCFRVIEVDNVATPMLYGTLSPQILIPKGITELNLSRSDLYYIFSHEVSHHFHHDLVTKQIIALFSLVYWWNPCCRILSRQADIALEMRVDDVVTAADAKTIAAYTRCLLLLYQHALDSGKIKFKKSSSSMPAIENEGQLIKRFQMMEASSQKHTKKKKKSWNIGLIVTLAIIFLSSYLFIFEAHYMSPEVAESTVALTDENGYAVKKEDGSYDVYYKGYFLENTEKLTYYDPDMPVYTEADAPAPLN